MQLSLGFSPCPNDTFIFDALVHQKVDTRGFVFDVVLEDVQTLNEWAQQGRLDVSKISYGVLPSVLPQYCMLQAGGALGLGVGPLLVASHTLPQGVSLSEAVKRAAIAIPGASTTAHFLFAYAFPQATHKVFMRFDAIENWVQQEKGLGVIIHENRFTYTRKGLHSWMDLGSYWEQQTGLPIPLGGIAAKRSLSADVLKRLNAVISDSLRYAWQQYPQLSNYVVQHAQEMQPEVMRAHIELYVNAFSDNVGNAGMEAVLAMLQSLSGTSHQPEEVFAL